jgi:hypothetical protein
MYPFKTIILNKNISNISGRKHLRRIIVNKSYAQKSCACIHFCPILAIKTAHGEGIS